VTKKVRENARRAAVRRGIGLLCRSHLIRAYREDLNAGAALRTVPPGLGVFVNTAILEFPHGLIVERPEDLLRMCERPRNGCETAAGVRSVVDGGILC
jgi:hypothetical protein